MQISGVFTNNTYVDYNTSGSNPNRLKHLLAILSGIAAFAVICWQNTPPIVLIATAFLLTVVIGLIYYRAPQIRPNRDLNEQPLNSSLVQNKPDAVADLDKLRHFSRILCQIGNHSRIDDIKQAIIDGACAVLNTQLVAMFVINPHTGIIERVSADAVTAELEDAFLEFGEQYLTDTGNYEADILDTETGIGPDLPGSGIMSVLASPMRSGSGVTGALAAFYTAREEAAKNERLIEAISIQASVIISFAMSAQQSRGLLDDFASDNQQLSVQATHDGLTGILNHKKLQQNLNDLCKQDLRANPRPFSLLMIDVDHFKRYNDTYGHQEGDEALKTVAGVIASKIRQSDFVARYGGEEFAVVIRASKDEALILAERIRLAVGSTNLHQGSVTISTGIAEYPSDGGSSADIIDKADKALYKAKSTGRNCVVVSDRMEINEEPRAA